MTALLAPLAWWPFSPTGPIQDVRPRSAGPGLVTLDWCTLEPCGTELRRRDGTVIYRTGRACTEHHVTLTGQAGLSEHIEIRAHGAVETVEIRF